ncbi:hypothetical protein [Lichenicola cladoniae]
MRQILGGRAVAGQGKRLNPQLRQDRDDLLVEGFWHRLRPPRYLNSK